MSIPDRSKHDENIAQSLSILGAAGNAALVERNYLLSEENRALLIQDESLLDGAAIRQGYVEEIEARNAALVRRIHELVIGNVLLRHGLDTLAAHLWGAA